MAFATLELVGATFQILTAQQVSGTFAKVNGTSINSSEVGIALSGSTGLQVGDRAALRLTLPHTQAAAKITAEVCWCDPAGQAGMEFIQVSAEVKEQLIAWLAARLEEYLPNEAPALKR